jgi:hypothetical protein
MEVIWLAALVLGSGFAIASGQGGKWKVLNAFIILTHGSGVRSRVRGGFRK